MAHTIGLILLCAPFVLILLLGGFVLCSNVFNAFAKSRLAWISSALVLPHFASKLMDNLYDACIAGNVGDAFLYGVPLAVVIIVLNLLMRAGAGN